MDGTVRTAGPEDLSAVMTLERFGFAPGIVEDEAVFERRIAAFPEGFLLAGDPPWGYLCAEVWANFVPDGLGTASAPRFDLGHDIGAWHRPDGETLYIASMTVAPEYRGSGRGDLLFRAGLTALVRRFSRVTQGVLIVNEHWLGARRIYSQAGFGEVGRLVDFFRPTDGPRGDALVLFHPRLADEFRAT
jgi:ribosomal-protein-alanine N-acetyltransferase